MPDFTRVFILRASLTLSLILLLGSSVKAARNPLGVQQGAVARIEKIVVQGNAVNNPGEQHVKVIRATSGSAKAGQVGLILYAEDRLMTGDAIVVLTYLGNESRQSYVGIGRNGSAIVRRESIFLRAGQVWVNAAGFFAVRTVLWWLGVPGTEFYFRVEDSRTPANRDTAKLEVASGAVDVSLASIGSDDTGVGGASRRQQAIGAVQARSQTLRVASGRGVDLVEGENIPATTYPLSAERINELNNWFKLIGAKPASVLEPTRSPLVAFRLLFMTGAAYDPPGKEGVASLTAALLAEGGSRALSHDEIIEAMHPMATSFGWQVDKEMTVFSGTTHADNLEKYYGLIRDMLLDPGFREDDFARFKTEAINFLKVSLSQGNDEELGKEHLYNVIYKGHPYGHHNMGTVSSLEKLTLDDVRAFYRENYTQSNRVIGLSGGYPADFPARVEADFAKLPAGSGAKMFAQPTVSPGMRIEIIQRETRATGISMGFPIPVTRADKDWPALALVASYLGQHRSSVSHLYQRLREARGLNYGDYAYVEYFPRGMFQFTPDPNLGRSTQIFQIWIRPVEPQNSMFALRAALYEYDKLVREGMKQADFEAIRDFLTKYSNVLTATQDARLGYALDSRYYGTPEYTAFMRERLSKLTLADVNRAIKQHLATDRMRIVMVTRDAAGLRAAIVKGAPSPIKYNSPKPDDIMAEDKIIERYKIDVRPDQIVIVPVEKVFQ
jgi:predicted Zn-dependent peptidase